MSDKKISALTAMSNEERRTIRRERMQLVLRNKTFLVGCSILGFWLLLSIFGDLIAPRGASDQDFEFVSVGPSLKYWFGTDANGQDVLSRVILGTRLIVVMAFSATAIGTVVGTAIGLAAGYFKGKFDMITMRLIEAISAIPVLIIALLAIAALEGRSPTLTVIVIGFVFTPNIGRTVRAAVLGEAELEYVAAARLRTERTPHILFREILPNVLPPIIVEFTVRLGYAIFAIATLSFLGAGVEYGSPNWGSQIAENWGNIYSNIWWPTAFPALAIASLAVSVNLISDSLLEVFEL
ncbi:MAG: ABC transporter permease [Actinomycetota bacterium]